MEVISFTGPELELGPVIDMPITTHLLPFAGKVDVANRYLSAVLVTVKFSEEQGRVCSGVIISRSLILTAGHCVCQRRTLTEPGGAQTLIDGSACAQTATVKTLVYKPGDNLEDDAASRGSYQRGTVRPHPELRILLDAQGRVVSSDGDLALILLDTPVDNEFRPIPLGDKDIQLNESLVIVGTGYDETARMYDGERRYSRNKVTELLPSGDGRLRIEQPGGHHYREDSGGPCLREGAEGLALVGLSSRNLGEGESITSTYSYRAWLRSEIRRADKLESSTRPK